MRRVKLLISGRVQGVFFRASALRKARELGLAGWVRNTSCGRVETLFEGGDQEVSEMMSWCRQGPPAALVSEVAVVEEPYRGEFTDFSLRF